MRTRRLARVVVGAVTALGLIVLSPTSTTPAPTPGPGASRTVGPVGAVAGPGMVPREDRRPPITPLRADPGRPVAPAPDRSALRERLAELLAHPEVATGGTVAVSVIDARGRPVFARDAERPLLPASTTKLVTAGAALLALGPDYRYTTSAVVSREPDSRGVVHGDLVVLGSGDPALGTPAFGTRVLPQRPRTPLEALADGIAARGVRVVTGGVVGDPSVFAHQPRPAGWPDRYLTTFEGTPSSGLTVDAGRAIRDRGDGVLVAERSPDPAATTAAALRALLIERGVEVRGGHASRVHDTPPPVRLAEVRSPPLRELLRYMVQHSDNHLADGIFRTLGVAAGDPTWTGAAAAARQALQPVGLDWDEIVLADGSGLSRDDRLSAAALTTLQRYFSTAMPQEWADLLALSGRSGTLRGRWTGTAAEAHVRGKTGTLRDVRSFVGTVSDRDGDVYHLAVLANDLDAAGTAAARRLVDLLVLVLIEDARDCTRRPPPSPTPPPTPTPAPPPDPAPGAEPGELVCAR
ncbi:MAG TPA: D-alanyl-D-alanine carboxypeptidase/D-alanyl-D-alanine-endopeptidase [Egibacteraceae bacterium]